MILPLTMIQRGVRRRVAWLGVAAMLFQAILFGWHHHELPPAARGAQPVIVAAGQAPLSPAAADDDCDICQALHHLSAAPGEFVAVAAPTAAGAPLPLPEPIRISRASERAFQARAPPRA
jgi:hypothetical protein